MYRKYRLTEFNILFKHLFFMRSFKTSRFIIKKKLIL